jgi:uncharacterized protein YggT (Ycf19 family)
MLVLANSTLHALLMVSHWMVITYAWLLVARATLDALIAVYPEWRSRLLPLDSALQVVTDPVLRPLRRMLRWCTIMDIDMAPVAGVLACLVLDMLITWVMLALP